MKAFILNSGTGSRMGDLTKDSHKSMVKIKEEVPLIYYQIKMLEKAGLDNILITTGHMSDKVKNYVNSEFNHLNITYAHNPDYLTTNYIYSIYLSLDKLNEDIIMLHGDLYFEESILYDAINSSTSCVVVDSTLVLPEKDFKAEIENKRVKKIATYINNDNCLSCQPLYKLNRDDWAVWKESIDKFCREGKTSVYAEEALNEVLDRVLLGPLDVEGRLCMEVDTVDDLNLLRSKL